MGEEAASTLAMIRRRLVFALLKPAARLAYRVRLPLKTVEELCRLAYFEEVRHRRDHSQQDVARLLGKSLRTVGMLEKQYKSDFLEPEDELRLVRLVEEAFATEPRTVSEVAEALERDPDEIEAVVKGLVTMRRLQPEAQGRFALNREFVSLVRGDLDARIDGLHHQLEVVARAVDARFLENGRPAVARTLSFVARDQDVRALTDTVVRKMRHEAIEAEETALREGGYEPYALTFALTPMEPAPEHDE